MHAIHRQLVCGWLYELLMRYSITVVADSISE